MQASYYYQGAGGNRDTCWADLQRLSKSKHLGYSIIWNYDRERAQLEIDPKTGEPKKPQPRY